MKRVVGKVRDTVVLAKGKATNKLLSVMSKKSEGAEGIIVAVILIVIAIALAIVFREQIGNAIRNALSTVSTNIDGLFTW